MQVEIRRQGIAIDEETLSHLQKRLDFALGRLDHRVLRVEVHLADEGGQRSGTSHRCRILVHLKHLPDVMVEDHDAHLTALIDRAVNRAGQVVRRELERRNTRGRKNEEE
jgi:ribosome-associated translation inhibitor RaiA